MYLYRIVGFLPLSSHIWCGHHFERRVVVNTSL